MNKRLLLPLLLVCTLLTLVTTISAVPPQATTEGWIVRSAIPDIFMKQDNVSYDFHAHVFDATTGNPINEDCTCYLHIYDDDGTHLYEGSDDTASHDWDYSFKVGEGNFSVGLEYTYILQCNGTYATDDEGGFYSGEFRVTNNGLLPIGDFTLALMIILCFIMFVGTIYTLLKGFERGANLEMDLSDIVKSFTAFGVFLLYYWFAWNYWGDTFVMSLLESTLWVVGFMSLFVTPIFFGFSIMKRVADKA